jgi:hypothetical protein
MINTMFAEEKKGEKEEKILCAENQKSCTQNSTPLENLFLGQIHSVIIIKMTVIYMLKLKPTLISSH